MEDTGPAEVINHVVDGVKGKAQEVLNKFTDHDGSSKPGEAHDDAAETGSEAPTLSLEEKPGGPLPVEPHVSHGFPE